MRQRLTELPGCVELEQLPVGPKTVLRKWRAEAGSLWVLLGPVGSFKSTILEILAGHTSVAGGAAVRFSGTMSYAPQLNWIQQTTIKDNIVCFEPWNERRYKAVLHACALENDLKTMPMHDRTIVAEKGLNLSGGQKQRLALARAVYREADIYLLDNPLSALDDQTQEHIWKHLIEGLLHNATVVVASSRPVISCTAVLHLSPDGLLREPEIVQGWCSAVHAGEAVPRRYSKSSSDAPKPSPLPPSHQETPQNVSLSRKSAVDTAVGDVLDSVLRYAFSFRKKMLFFFHSNGLSGMSHLQPTSNPSLPVTTSILVQNCGLLHQSMSMADPLFLRPGKAVCL
jgi:ABC-type Mn2+/Zn2+ transport system ATPase subunit